MTKFINELSTPFNNNDLSTLAALCGNERFPHALLIVGKSGMSMDNFLMLATAKALCTEQNAPCAKCSNCQKIIKNIHPDVVILGNEPSSDYKVKPVREMLEGLYILPNESERRVYVLKNADDISVISQNTLLKALEEPPEHAVFLLSCENIGALLATVRSRMVNLTLSAHDKENVLKFLMLHFPEREESEIKDTAEKAQYDFDMSYALLTGGAEHIKKAHMLYDYILRGSAFDFNALTYEVCMSGDFIKVFSALKEYIFTQTKNKVINSEIYHITPLRSVQIADIIEKVIYENKFTLNANLLAANISAKIFATHNGG